MGVRRLGIIMNGVTGRMGTNQHLIRSIVAIRDQGGVALANGDRVMPDPILVGRNEDKLAALAKAHGIARWTHRPRRGAGRPERHGLLRRRHHADAPARCSPRRSPPASTSTARSRSPPTWRRRSAIARKAKAAGVKHGVVQDKLFLPGLRKLKHADRRRLLRPHPRRCAASSATGSSRATCSRPSARRWNYRAEDGGGIILDMLCHWRYVLDNLFGDVQVGLLPRRHAHPGALRRGRQAATRPPPTTPPTRPSSSTAASSRSSTRPGRRACAATTCSTFQVDGTHGSAVAGLQRLPSPSSAWRRRKPVWNPDVKQTDRLLRQLAASAGRRRSSTTASSCSGSTSSATSSRTRRTRGTCSKAPRACSSSSARCAVWKERRWVDVPELQRL